VSPTAAARDFLAAMLEPRADPYAGADLDTSRRVTAALLGLSTLLALCFLPLEPPDGEFGWAGWLLAAALLVTGFAGTALVLVRRPGFRDLLGVAYAGVAGVAALGWLADGGASAYSRLLILWRSTRPGARSRTWRC
jgi:hypothetical protein